MPLDMGLFSHIFIYFFRSLSGDVKQLSLMFRLLIPQPSTSKLFIIQSIIFSLFWTPVHEMKRQAAKPVFLYLSSGKHNLPRLHSPPKHTSSLLTRNQEETRAFTDHKNTHVMTYAHMQFLISLRFL